jgi:hypothetical protein
MKSMIWLVAGAICAASCGLAAEASFKVVKDARILGHSSEASFNGGASARLRSTGIAKTSAEFILLDFDRAAIKAFVEKNADKTISGKLVLNVREVQGVTDPVELKVASIDAASAWNEGSGSQVQAKKGESCSVAARFDEQKWTLPDGKEVENFRALVWDGAKVRSVLNGKSVAVTGDSAGKNVEVVLEAPFVRHLATSATCQGIFVLHEHDKAKIDVFSKEQVRKGAELLLKAE